MSRDVLLRHLGDDLKVDRSWDSNFPITGRTANPTFRTNSLGQRANSTWCELTREERVGPFPLPSDVKVVSVNVGRATVLRLGRATVQTGIFKESIQGYPVWVRRDGLEGDVICSHQHHGGPDQAVYVYSQPDYDWWSVELGRSIAPGTFGENLTISEFESAGCQVGDRFEIDTLVLEVTAPRIPCGTFSARMEDPEFVQRFRAAERPGVYCRVMHEGWVEAGTPVQFRACGHPTVSILEMCRDFYEPELSEAAIRRFLAASIAGRVRAHKESQLRRLTTS